MESLTSEYAADGPRDEAERKREQLGEAWQKKLEDREKKAAEREKAKREQRDPTQDVDAFNLKFKNLATAVTQGLEDAKRKSAGEDGISRTQLAENMNKLQLVVNDMQAELAAATLYLAPYDVRQSSEKIATLTNEIAQARTTLAPRKKFAFKGRRNKAEKPAAIQNQPDAANSAAEDQKQAPPAEPKKETRAAEALLAAISIESDEYVVAQQTGATVEVCPKGPEQNVRIREMVDCTITLKHQSGAVRFVGLRNCRVAIGPIAGSCFFEDCHGCTFHVAARQIRIHDSTKNDFYLHVLSRPIFEHCSELRFAPYRLTYDALPAQLESAGLVAERATHMWKDVDDFRWLRQQQSPNWSILPEEEQKSWSL